MYKEQYCEIKVIKKTNFYDEQFFSQAQNGGLNRRSKRKYQCAEHDRLKELFNDQETRNFWKYIGKIGIQNDRKPSIPMEIVDPKGHVSTQTEEVLSRWKADY